MKKMNIAELLKDCPKGMELDCVLFDNVYLEKVYENVEYPIVINFGKTDNIRLTKEGCLNKCSNAKCVIFPKGKTTWEGFIPSHKFKDGDIISVIINNNLWYAIYQKEFNAKLYSYVSYSTTTENVYFLDKNGLCLIDDILEIRLATKNEKRKLFDVIKAKGYKWNTETKTLEKFTKFKVGDRITNGKTSITIGYIDDEYYYEIGKTIGFRLSIKNQDKWELDQNKFNINTLIPFESKILVRDNKDDIWQPAIYGCINKLNNLIYTMNNSAFYHCIPYEGNEHLVGTNNNCDDFYKTWEE